MGPNCPVTVDKHGSVIFFTPFPSTLRRGQKLNIQIDKSVVNIFTNILHIDRGTIDMAHIKRDFSSKACGLIPWVDLHVGVGQRPFFFKYGHVALKGTTHTATW